ncbi:MAG: helix-turn-helix domain containing protein [Helicobacteraceae bacterium]|jgi:hypothetical protein|nr:helix-turn-helix domain containing protein [Helicobacteraceae bacterium]
MIVENFEEVEKRLKIAFSVSLDSELAKILGMSKASYSKRKKANAIPYESIIIECVKRQISSDWIFGNKVSDASTPTIINGDTISVNAGHGNQISINNKNFPDLDEAADIVKNLHFAPKPFLDMLLEKLYQFKKMTKI